MKLIALCCVYMKQCVFKSVRVTAGNENCNKSEKVKHNQGLIWAVKGSASRMRCSQTPKTQTKASKAAAETESRLHTHQIQHKC